MATGHGEGGDRSYQSSPMNFIQPNVGPAFVRRNNKFGKTSPEFHLPIATRLSTTKAVVSSYAIKQVKEVTDHGSRVSIS